MADKRAIGDVGNPLALEDFVRPVVRKRQSEDVLGQLLQAPQEGQNVSERALREMSQEPTPTQTKSRSTQQPTTPSLAVDTDGPTPTQTQAPSTPQPPSAQVDVPSQGQQQQGGTAGASPNASELVQNQDEETKDQARRNQGVIELLSQEPGAAKFLFDMGTGILSQGLVQPGESAAGQIGAGAQAASQADTEARQRKAEERRQKREQQFREDQLASREERDRKSRELKKELLDKRLSAQMDRIEKKAEKKAGQELSVSDRGEIVDEAWDDYQNELERVCDPVKESNAECKNLKSDQGRRSFFNERVGQALGISEGDTSGLINKADMKKINKEAVKAKLRAGEPVSGHALEQFIDLPEGADPNHRYSGDPVELGLVSREEAQREGQEGGQEEQGRTFEGRSVDATTDPTTFEDLLQSAASVLFRGGFGNEGSVSEPEAKAIRATSSLPDDVPEEERLAVRATVQRLEDQEATLPRNDQIEKALPHLEGDIKKRAEELLRIRQSGNQ